MWNTEEVVPGDGYKLPDGWGSGFRATAIAYLEREGLFIIEHRNGKYYTLTQLKEARISS